MPNRPDRAALRAAVQHAARVRAEFTLAVQRERTALIRRTLPAQRQDELRTFDRGAAQQAAELTADLHRAIDAAQAALVLKATPSRRPASAAEASWCAALAASAPVWTPGILTSELLAAAKNNDRATLGILLPLAQSSTPTYRREFFSEPALNAAIREASAAITTPEEKQSAEDAAWCTAARREADWLHAVDKATNPVSALETNVRMQVFRTLMPGVEPPSFDVDGKEPPRAPLPEIVDATGAPPVPIGSIGATSTPTGGSSEP